MSGGGVPAAAGWPEEVQQKFEEQEENLQVYRGLVEFLISDRERVKRGREPTPEEVLEARTELCQREINVGATFFKFETDMRAELLRREEELLHVKGMLQQSSHRHDFIDEEIEALKSQKTLLQAHADKMEEDLAVERRERKLLQKEKDEWLVIQEEYVAKIEELRVKCMADNRTHAHESDKERMSLIRKHQDELALQRKRTEEWRRKADALEKQMDTMNTRLMEKDQGAELAYQKSLQFQELQRQELTKQLNWIMEEQTKERQAFETELAVKEKHLQALEAQTRVKEAYTTTVDQEAALQLPLKGQRETEATLRDQVDRLRLDIERERANAASRHRELDMLVKKLQAENASLSEKAERVEKLSHSRLLKIQTYQEKIATLNGDLRTAQVDREADVARLQLEITRGTKELQKERDERRHEVNLITEERDREARQAEGADRKRRELEQQLELKITQLTRRADEEEMLRKRDTDTLTVERNAVQHKFDELHKKHVVCREERVMAEETAARLTAKVTKLERELKGTTESTARLVERDVALATECHEVKVRWHQSKLELEQALRENQRLAVKCSELHKRVLLFTTQSAKRNPGGDPILALCGGGAAVAAKPLKKSRSSSKKIKLPAGTFDMRDFEAAPHGGVPGMASGIPAAAAMDISEMRRDPR